MYPPSPVMNREDRCQQPTENLLVIPPLPPVDLMYLASIAEQAGCEAKIADYSLGGDMEKDLAEFKPDYIVANVATPTFKSDMAALKKAKEIMPHSKIIVKGAVFLTYNTNAIYENQFLDYVIIGEAELTLKDILDNVPDNEISGLCYKSNMQGVKNKARKFNEDLDALPIPARHLVDNNLYRRPDNGKVQAVIKVSRGCPFHCFFCLATPVSGLKVRMRSVDNIIAEIKECIEKYNIKNFLFWSDIFDIDKNWTTALCRRIIDEKLNIVWSANTRADTISQEMADLMYKSGCRLMSIGVESGSQMILDNIGKRLKLDTIRKAVKILKKAKIKIYNYFVIGLPWETEETVEETVKFAIELDSDFISFYTATPLPGSRFYDYALKEKLFDTTTSYSEAYYYPVIRTHILSKEKVFELHKQAVKRFYLRPGFILRTLFRLRSFTEFKNYFRAGLNLLLRK